MTDRPDVTDSLADVGRSIAKPGTITEWDKDGKVRHRVECVRVGQFALNDRMFFVLENDRVSGFVYLADIRDFRFESRRSFKHPIAGTIFGVSAFLLPLTIFVGDPFFIGGFLGGGLFPLTGGFLMLLGAFTLYEVLRNRKVPWLIVETKDGPRPFMLFAPLAAEQEDLVHALAAAARASASS